MSSKHPERPDGRVSPETVPADPVGAPGTEGAEKPESSLVSESDEVEVAALRERVAALEARESALVEEVSSLKDQYLRKLADYENFRKRMFREREESLKFANTGLLSDLIQILDDFDRAVGSAEHVNEYAILHDGVVLIRRQFGQMLSNKYALSAFSATGQAFDPNIHEAVASELADVSEPLVSQEFLPGYKLNDRVIRSAKVKVQMPSPEAMRSAQENPAEPPASGGVEAGPGMRTASGPDDEGDVEQGAGVDSPPENGTAAEKGQK